MEEEEEEEDLIILKVLTSSAVAPWGRGPRRALSAVDPLMSGVPLFNFCGYFYCGTKFISNILHFVPLGKFFKI